MRNIEYPVDFERLRSVKHWEPLRILERCLASKKAMAIGLGRRGGKVLGTLFIEDGALTHAIFGALTGWQACAEIVAQNLRIREMLGGVRAFRQTLDGASAATFRDRLRVLPNPGSNASNPSAVESNCKPIISFIGAGAVYEGALVKPVTTVGSDVDSDLVFPKMRPHQGVLCRIGPQTLFVDHHAEQAGPTTLRYGAEIDVRGALLTVRPSTTPALDTDDGFGSPTMITLYSRWCVSHFRMGLLEISVGQSRLCEVQIVDEKVADVHAVFRQADGGREIVCMGKPIWLNGDAIQSQRPVVAGDFVSLGCSLLHLGPSADRAGDGVIAWLDPADPARLQEEQAPHPNACDQSRG